MPNLQDFDFELSEDLIALRPLQKRESARLLVVHDDGRLEHRQVGDLPEFLASPDIVVVNDSRVIPARLTGFRPARHGTGQTVPVELLLLGPSRPGQFRAFAKPARRLKPGDRLVLGTGLEATIAGRLGPEVTLSFVPPPDGLEEALEREGQMPLPPYIAAKRPPDQQDRTDYQTIYAAEKGSVAAPTAGLHFTPELLEELKQRNVGQARVTLHVGAGTFLPVAVENIADHKMHSEWVRITADNAAGINKARDAGGRILAVGTTSLRSLECAAEPGGYVPAFRGDTDIFITPGYRFKTADMLLTNFHLPRSTLFMLVCAFAGTEVMRAAYAEAIAEAYRFYSYGDACLLYRKRS